MALHAERVERRSIVAAQHEVYTQASALWKVIARIGADILEGFEQHHRAGAEFEARAMRLFTRADGEREYLRAAQGLGLQALDALPRTRPTAEDVEAESCPICLDAYSPGDEIMRMPCAHTVHWRCGARWLICAQTCPSCRFDMSVDEIVRSKS